MFTVSDALKFISEHCIRHPISCASSSDVINKQKLWEMNVVDDSGNVLNFTYDDIEDQLYNYDPCTVGGGINPCTYDTFLAAREVSRLQMYIDGFSGTIIDPLLGPGVLHEITIEPIERDRCEIVGMELTRECGGFSGPDSRFGTVTFSNTNRQFDSYYAANQNKSYDCNINEITYKRVEDDNIAKHFNLGVGFRWNGKEECVTLLKGLTGSRAEKTIENTGYSLAQFNVQDPYYSLKSATVTRNVTTTLSDHLSDLLTPLGIPFILRIGNYDPSFTINEDNASFDDVMAKICEATMSRFYYDPQLNTFIFETLDWWELNRRDPIYEINTCDHIIKINPPIIAEDKSSVTVEQFTQSGGITASRGDISVGLQKITNDYISTQNMADYLADKIYQNVRYGTQERSIEIIGLPFLEVGDVITVKERVDVDSRNGTCQNIYEVSNWRICRITDSIDNNGYTQRLVLDKIGIRPYVRIENQLTNNTCPIISGQVSDPTSTLVLTYSGNDYSVPINPNGTWSFNMNLTGDCPFSDGLYNLGATVTDSIGQEGSTTATFTIDTSPPPAPTVNCYTTNDTTPTLSGTASSQAVNTIITVNGNNYNVIGTSFNFTVSPALTDGVYPVTAKSYDAAGNVSSTYTCNLIIDTTPPPPPVQTTLDPQPSATFTVTGTGENGATVRVLINNVLSTFTSTVVSGTYSISIPGLTPGIYTVVTYQTDVAGNNSLPSAPQNVTII